MALSADTRLHFATIAECTFSRVEEIVVFAEAFGQSQEHGLFQPMIEGKQAYYQETQRPYLPNLPDVLPTAGFTQSETGHIGILTEKITIFRIGVSANGIQYSHRSISTKKCVESAPQRDIGPLKLQIDTPKSR